MRPYVGNVNVLVGPGHTAKPHFQTVKEAFESQDPDDENRLLPANLFALEWLHGEKDMLHSIIRYQTDLLVVVPVIRPMQAGREDVQRLLSLVKQAQEYALIIFAVHDPVSKRMLVTKCPNLEPFTFATLGTHPEEGIIPVLRRMELPTPQAVQALQALEEAVRKVERDLERKGRERLASRLDPKIHTLMSPMQAISATE